MHALALKITVEVYLFSILFIISLARSFLCPQYQRSGVYLSFGLCAFMCEELFNDLQINKCWTCLKQPLTNRQNKDINDKW